MVVQLQMIDKSEYSSKKCLHNYPIISGITLTILIGFFLFFVSIIKLGDSLFNAGLDYLTIILILFSGRFILGAVLLLLILPFLFYYPYKINRKSYLQDDLLLTKGPSFQITLFIGLLSIALYIILGYLLAAVLGILQIDLNKLIASPNLEINDPGWTLFLLSLVPGIWEELAFRGYILQSLKKKYSINISIILSSILFGLYHFFNVINQDVMSAFFGVIMATSFGLIWGYMTVKSGSVLPAMITHYLVDASNFFFVNVTTSNEIVVTQFFILLVIFYPLINYFIAKVIFQRTGSITNVQYEKLRTM